MRLESFQTLHEYLRYFLPDVHGLSGRYVDDWEFLRDGHAVHFVFQHTVFERKYTLGLSTLGIFNDMFPNLSKLFFSLDLVRLRRGVFERHIRVLRVVRIQVSHQLLGFVYVVIRVAIELGEESELLETVRNSPFEKRFEFRHHFVQRIPVDLVNARFR